jgi:RNA polymerase sigma factor (sigma-70 family)
MPDQPPTDDPNALTSLHVRGAIAGAAGSVEWIVARFTPLLRAQAAHRLDGPLRRVVDPEDLVQDVWTRALPRLPDLEPRDGRFTPVLVRFLATTLLNRVNNLLQRQLRADGRNTPAGADPLPSTLSAEATQALNGVLRAERTDAVHAAIEALEPEDRVIVILRGIEQHPLSEVAVILSLVPNTVSVRYRRALEKLRRALPGSIFDELPEPLDA